MRAKQEEPILRKWKRFDFAIEKENFFNRRFQRFFFLIRNRRIANLWFYLIVLLGALREGHPNEEMPEGQLRLGPDASPVGDFNERHLE
jgi:hypothetical protein